MKKSELSIIAVIVVIAFIVAYFVGNSVLGKMNQKGVSVQDEPKISGEVAEPDGTIFYSGAKNPTVQITIGNSSNQQPLSGGQ